MRLVETQVVRAGNVHHPFLFQNSQCFAQNSFLISHVLDNLIHRNQIETRIGKWKHLAYASCKNRFCASSSCNLDSSEARSITDAIGFYPETSNPAPPASRHKTAYSR